MLSFKTYRCPQMQVVLNFKVLILGRISTQVVVCMSGQIAEIGVFPFVGSLFFQKSEAGQSIGIKPWNMYKKVSSFAVPCTAHKFWSWSLLPGKVCPYSWCCPWFLDRRRRWVQNASVEKIGSSVGDSTVSTDEPWRVDWDLGRCWFHVGNLTVFNHIGLVNQE